MISKISIFSSFLEQSGRFFFSAKKKLRKIKEKLFYQQKVIQNLNTKINQEFTFGKKRKIKESDSQR